jgi:histidinol dehydrogenase
VTTESFLKTITYQEITPSGLLELGPVVERLALAEGLDAHSRAVSIRMSEVKKT